LIEKLREFVEWIQREMRSRRNVVGWLRLKGGRSWKLCRTRATFARLRGIVKLRMGMRFELRLRGRRDSLLRPSRSSSVRFPRSMGWVATTGTLNVSVLTLFVADELIRRGKFLPVVMTVTTSVIAVRAWSLVVLIVVVERWGRKGGHR
jgi:hypothetical protein